MAMIWTVRGALTGLALGATVLLAGCGTEAQDNSILLAGRTAVSLFQRGEAEAPPPTPVVTRDLVERVNQPLIMVVPLQLGGASLFTRVGDNRGNEAWRGPEQIGVTLTDGGLLRSTRGLGFDLMASDVQGTAATLCARR